MQVLFFILVSAFGAEQLSLNAYEQLNYRLATDPEFKVLLQTEVVGFGVDELNDGIFIEVESTYASQENFERYEKIFRVTVGEDVPIKFEEVNSIIDPMDNGDYDSRILLILLAIPVIFGAVVIYLKQKNKESTDKNH